MSLTASIVITTRNRREELRRALSSAVGQAGAPEIVVIDDGSTDATAEMVRAEFPQVALHRFEEPKGLVVRRNDAARLAHGDVIFSIDDDAVFSTPHVVEQTLEFDSPRIGAVAIPYIEPRREHRVMQRRPTGDRTWIAPTFIGTSHAVRRDLFLRLGGYREHLIHQGEEPDYCIRLLDAGYVVRLGNADMIEHLESDRRDLRRMDFYGCRNAVLFAWQNVPAVFLPLYLLATTVNCLRWPLGPVRFLYRLHGIIAGYWDCFRASRQPVAISTYRKWRKLKSEEAVPVTFQPGDGDFSFARL